MKRFLPLIPLALALAWWVWRQRVAAVPPQIPFPAQAWTYPMPNDDGTAYYPVDNLWRVTC